MFKSFDNIKLGKCNYDVFLAFPVQQPVVSWQQQDVWTSQQAAQVTMASQHVAMAATQPSQQTSQVVSAAQWQQQQTQPATNTELWQPQR